jgi:hypothetical protein
MADAVRAVTREDLQAGVPACLLTWTGLDTDDSGTPVELVDYADRTVTITGTFGAGGSITIQGSNDNTNWFAVTDPQGNAITKTAAGMETLMEAPRYIRPLVTAGDGTTSLTVKILCRRTVR